MRLSYSVSVFTTGLAIGSCQPARPLLREISAEQYVFQDRQTGRPVGRPFQALFGPLKADRPRPLPRRALIVEWDTVKNQFWLLNAWGERVEQPFLTEGVPDELDGGMRRYTNDARRVGFLNRRGQVQIPAQFTVAGPFHRGYSVVGQGCQLEPYCPGGDMEHAVWRGGRWGIIDRRGRVVVPLQYNALFSVAGHDNWLAAVKGPDTVLITRSGRRLPPQPYRAYTRSCHAASPRPVGSDSLPPEERQAGRDWEP